VRKILAWLKQQHFWVLSVLIALISVFCWWSGAGSMSKKYAENEGKIKGGFSTVDTVLGDTFHPNDEIKKRQEEEIAKLVEEVTKLWEDLYKKQSDAVLIWPSGVGQLSADFVKEVEKLEFGAEIEHGWREHYQNYISNHFPDLPKKIGARPISEDTTGTAGGPAGFSRIGRMSEGPGGPMTTGTQFEDDGNYICEWAEDDQARVRATLQFERTPSPLWIWCTQEDLWVYHALLNVIRNTNDAANATRISNAAVRGVYSLQVGQSAAPFSRTPNRIFKLATPAAAAPGEFAPGAPGDPMSPESAPAEFSFSGPSDFSRGGPSGGEMTEEQERAVLLHGRYLGEDGKPIPFGGGGGGMAGPDAPAEPVADVPAGPLDLSVFGKEYKRLPVRMVLEMDQRHLPKLIAECALQPLQIEVQEVRVNADDLEGGSGSPMGGRMSSGPGMGSEFSMPELSGLQQFNPQPQIATVAIQGVIYIFKKPDRELLKPPTDESTSVAQNP
jgi:hypothetical protein